jgi:hypothetical protein
MGDAQLLTEEAAFRRRSLNDCEAATVMEVHLKKTAAKMRIWAGQV